MNCGELFIKLFAAVQQGGGKAYCKALPPAFCLLAVCL